MKNFRLSALLCCVSLCGFAACSDDKTDDQPEPQAYQVTQFESSTIPASIPGEGGGYKLTFVIRTETRSTGATCEEENYVDLVQPAEKGRKVPAPCGGGEVRVLLCRTPL